MTTKMIPKPELTLVCDLCGEEIDTYGNRDRAALNYGYTPYAEQKGTAKSFTFFRKAHETNNYKPIDWDFHGECIVKALSPLILEEED